FCASSRADEFRDAASCDGVQVSSEPGAASQVPAALEEPLGESRWPPAAALVVFMAVTVAVRLWLPGASEVRVPWLIPPLEAGLLVTLLASDPARLARHARWAHRIAIAIVILLVAAALWATALLVYDMIRGHGVSRSATQLLAAGAIVWVGNNLAFG